MVQVKAPLLVHKKVAADHYLMRLKAPLIARCALPGQFIHLRCGEEKSTFPLLRRPLSLMEADPTKGTIDFIYKVVGFGTHQLSRIPEGSRLDTLGPLGHPFEVPSHVRRAYLVGGGVGIPPLVLLAKKLIREKRQVVALLGARTKEWVICRRQFLRYGIEPHVATDDGTLGTCGSVVDLLQKSFSSPSTGNDNRRSTALYICGPTPMMAAAAAVARQFQIPAQVSLEERMGCAMGCCLGCVVEMAHAPVTSDTRFQRVCTEGPVFSAQEVLWRSTRG